MSERFTAVSGSTALLVIALLALAAAAVWFLAARRRHEVWRRFARAHGLQRLPGTSLRHLRLGGTVDGRAFELYTAQASSDTGVLGVEEIVMKLVLRGPLPAGFAASRGGVLGEVEKTLAHEGAVRVDPALDERVRVSGEDPQAVRAFLTPARRAALAELVSVESACIPGVEEGAVFLREREMISSPAHLESRLALLRSVAARLDG